MSHANQYDLAQYLGLSRPQILLTQTSEVGMRKVLELSSHTFAQR